MCNEISILICWNSQKRKNSKNDFPREVAKKLREGKFATSAPLCNDFLLSNDYSVSFEVISQVVVFGHSYKKEKTYDIAAVRFRFSCLCKKGN